MFVANQLTPRQRHIRPPRVSPWVSEASMSSVPFPTMFGHPANDRNALQPKSQGRG